MRHDPDAWPMARLIGIGRSVYAWIFVVWSLIGIYVHVGMVLQGVRTHPIDKVAIFSSTTLGLYEIVYGIAGWMIVRGKPALKRWAMAANFIFIFFWAPVLVSGNWRGFLEAERHWWLFILFGVLGIAIFSAPYEGPAASDASILLSVCGKMLHHYVGSDARSGHR